MYLCACVCVFVGGRDVCTSITYPTFSGSLISLTKLVNFRSWEKVRLSEYSLNSFHFNIMINSGIQYLTVLKGYYRTQKGNRTYLANLSLGVTDPVLPWLPPLWDKHKSTKTLKIDAGQSRTCSVPFFVLDHWSASDRYHVF